MTDEFPLILSDETKVNSADIERLFGIFKNDFIDTIVTVTIDGSENSIFVKPDVVCHCPFGNTHKPERFWHIITKKEYEGKKKNNPCPDDRERNRAYDPSRAKRIHWIKQTIENIGKDEIKYFFEEDTHFLWDTKRFYMVLIKHLGLSKNLLVTAYPVHQNKYREFKRKLKKYEEKK